MQQNPDPLTPLLEGAAQMHELYLSYVQAGFTEQQALALLQTMLVETIRAPGQS